MKVVIYPADAYGCGYHRLIWPAELLRSQGYDVSVVLPSERSLSVKLKGDEVIYVDFPEGVDVVVFQRVTHKAIPAMIDYCSQRGIATVIDIDDDLGAIHPANPAAAVMNLTYTKGGRPDRTSDIRTQMHSWRWLEEACKRATMVQVATDELVSVYGLWRPTRVINNYLSAVYADVPHVDNELIGWPASLHSHPNDPPVVGNAIQRVVAEGARFAVMSLQPGVARAFNLRHDPVNVPSVELEDWARTIALFGIGIVPLANTKFNRSKSWLKPLELSAAGVPWVGSPRREYRRLHELGAGVLATQPREWYTALRELLDHPEHRLELSEAGRAVAKTLRLEDHVWRWWECWSDALKLMRG